MTTSAATLADEAIAQVRAAEDARARALVGGDAAALRELVDEQLIVTHSNGRRETGAELVDALAQGRLRYARFESRLDGVVVRTDHAVVTGELRAAVVLPDGAEHPIHALSTSVWSRRDDRWLLLAAHTTTAPAAAKP